jgi:endoglucanase
MKRELQWMMIIALILTVNTAAGQVPFNRGVNLTGWFQTSSPRQIQYNKFTKQDLVNIKSLGCDVIRLPINMHVMTSGSPNFIPDPLFVSFLDSVVTWAEDLNIYLIIDNHSELVSLTTTEKQDELTKLWTQLAQHYASRSDYVIYEILNEPHDITASVWGSIQQAVINAIRTKDTKHKIIVGGVNYNTYTELANIPVYTDSKLIYTFHFYDPFMFTHQGATWVTPSMAPLAGVPFPYNAAEMPACPASLVGTWVESGLNSYPTQGTVAYVKSLIDIAAAFKNSRNVPVYCGELGVYKPNSDPADRVYWYGAVRQYLEEKGIPWTMWDYKGSFGLFKNGSNELFDYDLNIPLVDTLGFNIPAQKTWKNRPDSVGFPIYTDYIAQYINDISYTSGTIDFYNNNMPNNGNYCLDWKNYAIYNTVGFDFAPDKDLSQLKSGGYALDFIVRGNLSGIMFDVRFMDTKTGAADHPWRMKYTIDNTLATWDKRWHHVHIDLGAFTEGGSWDNGTWYNQQGLFDWTAVDNFQVSSEYTVAAGTEIWFDNIHITNLDTATVRETGTVGIKETLADDAVNLRVRPNPFVYETHISYALTRKSRVSVCITDISGNRVRCLEDAVLPAGDYTSDWDGRSASGATVPAGVYLCVLDTPQKTYVCRVIKAGSR